MERPAEAEKYAHFSSEKSDYEYNMVTNPGPLADEWLKIHQDESTVHVTSLAELPVAGTFAGGKYNEVVLSEDVVLYRAGGELYSTSQPSRHHPEYEPSGIAAREGWGQFFTAQPAQSIAHARIDTAIRPHWPELDGSYSASSPVREIWAARIPAGTTVYVGPTASQGGGHVVGAEQIYVSEPWRILGAERWLHRKLT